MKTVLILMSTYNGARFLEEQLDSLLNQENVNVKILVRDDGSTDNTKQILKKYELEGKLNWYAGENIGWRKSFMQLAESAPSCDYYAFCDQDDVWLSNKLCEAVSKLEEYHNDEKLLYFSNMLFWKNGRVFGKIKPLQMKYTHYSSAYQNPTAGCTMVFNKELMDFLKSHPFEDVLAHDFWFFQTAFYFGRVVYDPNAYILYRQHELNQVGVTKSFWELWARRIKRFFKQNGKTKSQNASDFLRIYGNELSTDDYIIFNTVANYKTNLRKKLLLLCSKKYTMNAFSNTFLMKIRILFNRF